MDEIVTTGIKALNGGLFVVAFALIAEISIPKLFAGVFSAAPSIALANLLVILLAKGTSDARTEATGMIVGAAAMAISCAVGIAFVRRYRALRGSVLLCLVWLVLAEGGYLLLLR